MQCKVCLQSILADTLRRTRHELGQFKNLHKHSSLALSPCWYNLSLSRLLTQNCFYVNIVIQLLMRHWQNRPVSAIHHCVKNTLQQDHIQTPRVSVQRPTHLEPEVGTRSRAIIVPGQDLLHLAPINTLPSHVFSVWIWKRFLHAFSCSLKAEYVTHLEAL